MDRPKLRKVERFEQDRDEGRILVVRDPMGVSEPFAIDAQYAPVLDLLDGTRTVAQIRHSLLLRGELDLPLDDLAEFVGDLDAAGVLDSDQFREAWAQLHATFVESDPRPPRLAGTLYPDDAAEIRAELEAAVPVGQLAQGAGRFDAPSVSAVVVPHGPIALTGSVIDDTLRGLPPAEDLDLVVILGTDFGSGLTPYVATHKAYATPLGTARCATEAVAALERRLPWIVREEVRHRDAMSLELAVLLLQHVYGDDLPPICPVLCGQTALAPDDPTDADRFVATLEALCDHERVLIWCSAELGHGGPAYGRPQLDDAARSNLAERDHAIAQALCSGRAAELVRLCAAPHPHGRPSGGAALATLAKVLPVGFRAQRCRYVQAPPPGHVEGAAGLVGIRFFAEP